MAGSDVAQRPGVLNLYEEELLALVALAVVGSTHPHGTDDGARLAWILGCRAVEKAQGALAAGSPELVAPFLESWARWREEWRARGVQAAASGGKGGER